MGRSQPCSRHGVCHVVISIQRQLLEGTSSLPFSHGSELYPGAVECHQSCYTVYKPDSLQEKMIGVFLLSGWVFLFPSANLHTPPSYMPQPKAQSAALLLCPKAAAPLWAVQHCVPPWPHCLASWSPKETAAFSFPIPFSSDVQTLLTSVLLAGDPLWHPVRCWAAGQLPAQDLFTLHFPLPFFFFCEDAAASLPC